MKNSFKGFILFFIAMGLPLLGCGSVQLLAPSATPLIPPTSTPIPSTPTPIPPDLSGRVTSDEAHSAGRFFTLCMIVASGCQFTSLVAVSNSDGYFKFQDVPVGDYYIFYDSGYEDFNNAVKKWNGNTIQVGNVQWLADNFITHNDDGTFSFTMVSGMKLDKNTAYMAVYRFFAKSPFLWAHKCVTNNCSTPEDVSPIVAEVSNGTPGSVEFEVFGPFDEYSGDADQTPDLTPAPTPVDAQTGLFFDDFHDATFDGGFDPNRWTYQSSSSDVSIRQADGSMVLSVHATAANQWGNLKSNQGWSLGEFKYVEARLKLDPDHTGDMGNAGFSIGDVGCSVQIQGTTTPPFIWCAQSHTDQNQQWVSDYMSGSYYIEYGKWYTTRIEFNPQTNEFTCTIDGKFFTSWQAVNVDNLLGKKIPVSLGVWADNGTTITGYVDDVRVVK